MPSQKVNVIVVNLPLLNFAAGEPSVSNSRFLLRVYQRTALCLRMKCQRTTSAFNSRCCSCCMFVTRLTFRCYKSNLYHSRFIRGCMPFLSSALKSFSLCCYIACFFSNALLSVHLLMPLLNVLITNLSMAFFNLYQRFQYLN